MKQIDRKIEKEKVTRNALIRLSVLRHKLQNKQQLGKINCWELNDEEMPIFLHEVRKFISTPELGNSVVFFLKQVLGLVGLRCIDARINILFQLSQFPRYISKMEKYETLTETVRLLDYRGKKCFNLNPKIETYEEYCYFQYCILTREEKQFDRILGKAIDILKNKIKTGCPFLNSKERRNNCLTPLSESNTFDSFGPVRNKSSHLQCSDNSKLRDLNLSLFKVSHFVFLLAFYSLGFEKSRKEEKKKYYEQQMLKIKGVMKELKEDQLKSKRNQEIMRKAMFCQPLFCSENNSTANNQSVAKVKIRKNRNLSFKNSDQNVKKEEKKMASSQIATKCNYIRRKPFALNKNKENKLPQDSIDQSQISQIKDVQLIKEQTQRNQNNPQMFLCQNSLRLADEKKITDTLMKQSLFIERYDRSASEDQEKMKELLQMDETLDLQVERKQSSIETRIDSGVTKIKRRSSRKASRFKEEEEILKRLHEQIEGEKKQEKKEQQMKEMCNSKQSLTHQSSWRRELEREFVLQIVEQIEQQIVNREQTSQNNSSKSQSQEEFERKAAESCKHHGEKQEISEPKSERQLQSLSNNSPAAPMKIVREEVFKIYNQICQQTSIIVTIDAGNEQLKESHEIEGQIVCLIDHQMNEIINKIEKQNSKADSQHQIESEMQVLSHQHLNFSEISQVLSESLTLQEQQEQRDQQTNSLYRIQVYDPLQNCSKSQIFHCSKEEINQDNEKQIISQVLLKDQFHSNNQGESYSDFSVSEKSLDFGQKINEIIFTLQNAYDFPTIPQSSHLVVGSSVKKPEKFEEEKEKGKKEIIFMIQKCKNWRKTENLLVVGEVRSDTLKAPILTFPFQILQKFSLIKQKIENRDNYRQVHLTKTLKLGERSPVERIMVIGLWTLVMEESIQFKNHCCQLKAKFELYEYLREDENINVCVRIVLEKKEMLEDAMKNNYSFPVRRKKSSESKKNAIQFSFIGVPNFKIMGLEKNIQEVIGLKTKLTDSGNLQVQQKLDYHQISQLLFI